MEQDVNICEKWKLKVKNMRKALWQAVHENNQIGTIFTQVQEIWKVKISKTKGISDFKKKSEMDAAAIPWEKTLEGVPKGITTREIMLKTI